jgi:hypothetical protein
MGVAGEEMKQSDNGLQPLPGPTGPDLNSHHAGNVGALALSETRISIPLTFGMAVSSCTDSTINSEPTFVSQAKDLFMTPPSA